MDIEAIKIMGVVVPIFSLVFVVLLIAYYLYLEHKNSED